MFEKDKSARDAFTLSLGGVTTISSFATAPAIAHDRLRQVQVDQVQVDQVQVDQVQVDQVQVDCDQQHSLFATLPSFGRFWWRRAERSRAA